MFDYSKVEHYRYSTSLGSHEIKWGLRRVDNGERVVADDCLLLAGHARHFYIDLYDTGIVGESLLDQMDFESAIAPYLDHYWGEDLGCANRVGDIEDGDYHLYDREVLEQLALLKISACWYYELIDSLEMTSNEELITIIEDKCTKCSFQPSDANPHADRPVW
ncbi:MAG: hypothetical protein COA96_13080 [SAR86 cluster bacterium]|uniref:Uncharacterized protein n=1 Tax=SAR86 cluster bacterium TaxID=2030880 RepID=A0A2A5AVT0_9GAMM|nr:MAG: hypothetical protein COA96_13080 [SAR86 cluster bacterium]